MQTRARERALVLLEIVLLEIAKRSRDSKDRALHLAKMWLALAVLEDALAIWAQEAKNAMH